MKAVLGAAKVGWTFEESRLVEVGLKKQGLRK